MNPNPAIGVIFHWLGGLASGSFYVPYRGVKLWAWETYWLVGGFFSWIIVPWMLGSLLTHDLFQVLHEAPATSLFWTYFFGVLWGLGGLTFGLTMRYLGMSLGMAVALGYTAAFGTLMPPIFRGVFATEVLGTTSGRVILIGVAACLAGIVFAGLAGMHKERELSEEQKRASIREFALKKGLLVATFCGIMSACFAYGLAAGDPIKALTIQHGTAPLWQGLPVLVVLLLGGFTTNFIWCLILNIRNKTGYQYLHSEIRGVVPSRDEEYVLETATDAPGEEMAVAVAVATEQPARAPMVANYLFSALAGTTWYMQFFFYTMGETKMGRFKFSSWTLHMASIIIFSTLWGIALKEWKGVGPRTKWLVALSLFVLVASTVIVGYGNYLGLSSSQH
ncbi:MAG: L-rhamnose/proton symporter RhaT [Acidobacteria bacterium]|nr:MAG: L-rhamnose/proton symporter RhaT [Acidobacteriota bacterium]PYY24649.1 MAG: L-rhamnose/proton symporter RhaT [Acidobacteriota bacterium]